MRKAQFYIFIIGVFFTVLFPQIFLSCSSDDNKQKVIECYEKYNKAIINGDGEEAIKYLDSRTFDYYGNMLEKALYADKESLSRESFVNRMMILQIRHMIPLENVLNMDAKNLLIYAINNDWIGKKYVVGVKVRNVKIEGNFAVADSYKDNVRMPKYSFYYEKDQWKFNLTSLVTMIDPALKKEIIETGLSENEFILFALETLSGKSVLEDIYIPLIKRNEK